MISLLHIVVPDKLNLICLQAIVLDNLFETRLSRQGGQDCPGDQYGLGGTGGLNGPGGQTSKGVLSGQGGPGGPVGQSGTGGQPG